MKIRRKKTKKPKIQDLLLLYLWFFVVLFFVVKIMASRSNRIRRVDLVDKKLKKKEVSKYTGEEFSDSDSANDDAGASSSSSSSPSSDDDGDDGGHPRSTRIAEELEFSSSDEERLPAGFKSKKARRRKRIRVSDSDEAEAEAELSRKAEKYARKPASSSYRDVRNPKLRSRLKRAEEVMRETARATALNEVLLPETHGYMEGEGEMEHTDRLSQGTVARAADVQSARKAFDLKLTEMGPYVACAYSRNGRSLLLGGAKGHVALLRWRKGQLKTELQLKETVRDVTFLHDESLFAVAQRKYVHIYDAEGVELHCLKRHINANRLAFLAYHFLLVSIGLSGHLTYQDVSTGEMVVHHPTRLGPCRAMCQNPWNAVIHCGHSEGTVTMWAPNITKPLVKMLCHRGPVQDLAVDAKGNQMVTCGLDSQVKLWDLRNTYRELHALSSHRPSSSVAISQRGLIALAQGPHVQVWPAEALRTRVARPYMRSIVPGHAISRVAFCPYEDVLGMGHSEGFSSLLIPGAGEPNYDAHEANPFQTNKQRREHQVHQLLDKIQPDMISLEANFVGNVDPRSLEQRQKTIDEHKAAAHDVIEEKRMKKGVDTAKLRAKRRKRANIRDAKSQAIDDAIFAEKQRLEAAKEEKPSGTKSALDRFKKIRS